MDINVLVTLLTITVILLSIVIIGLLVTVIAVLVKVRQVAERLDVVLRNVASASEWLAPAKVISHISRIFRK